MKCDNVKHLKTEFSLFCFMALLGGQRSSPWCCSGLPCQQRKSTESFQSGGHSQSDDMYGCGEKAHVNSHSSSSPREPTGQRSGGA